MPETGKYTYKRAMVNVDRGPMSSTTVTVRPWEVPILKEMHGAQNVRVVTGEEEVAHANTLKLLMEEEFDPNEMQSEYSRLCTLYGRHPTIDALVVERVYGIFDDGRFERAVMTSCGQFTNGAQAADEISRNVVMQHTAAPTMDDLRTQCEELGIDWQPNMSYRMLKALIDDAVEGDHSTQKAA